MRSFFPNRFNSPWKGLQYIFILSLFAPYNCYSASFDCKKAQNQIEEVICEDQKLSESDEILNFSYNAVLKIAPMASALKAEQKTWLIKIRNRCKDAACLSEAYSARITELETSWGKYTKAINAASARNRSEASKVAKPFEGNWRSCQLYMGRQICSSYMLLQRSERICGEWEYWATSRAYTGRLQAKSQAQNQATLELICGDPGGNTKTECTYQNNAKETWEKAKGSLLVCSNQLHDDATKTCSALSKSSGYPYQAFTEQQRGELLSQPWVQRCLSGTSSQNN